MHLSIQILLIVILAGSFAGMIWLMWMMTRLIATLNKRQTGLFENTLEKYHEFLFYGKEGMQMKEDAVNQILNGEDNPNEDPYDPLTELNKIETELS